MGDRISAAQLAEIEKRANGATPGPWKAEANKGVWDMDLGEIGPSVEPGIASLLTSEDASFIANARWDVIALVNETREAWGEAEALRQSLWNVYTTLGFDTDGDKEPRGSSEALCRLVEDAAEEHREIYDECPSIEELASVRGEAEAATRVLADLIDVIARTDDTLNTKFSAYIASELSAARALVGSENRNEATNDAW